MARRVLRIEQIAERTGQTVGTIRWLRARGEGPPMFRLGRRVVAFEDEVDRYIEEKSKGPTATGRKVASA